MDMQTVAKEATENILSMLGISAVYIDTIEQSALSSANDVNVIIGFTEGIRGNAMLGMDREIAMRLASIMMGGMEVSELDELTISAIAELGNMIVGNTFTNLASETSINFSPPTVVVGDGLKIMISRVSTQKLHYEVDGKSIYLLLCVE